MPAPSKNPAYIAGRADFENQRPRSTKRFATATQKQRYLDGYHKAEIRAQKEIDKGKPREHPTNPLAVCAATGVRTNEMYMGAYDPANDQFFVTPEVMDRHHEIGCET